MGPCDRSPSDWLSTSLYVAGGLAIAAGTVDDIVRQPALVRRHNRRIRDLALAPLVTPALAGVSLGGRF